jgi:hypothetical protein
VPVDRIGLRGFFGVEHWQPRQGKLGDVLELQRLMAGADAAGQVLLAQSYQHEIDRLSELVWEIERQNLVVTQGRNEILDKAFAASGFTAAYYMALKSSGTAVAADTAASHASWTEPNIYSQGTRPQVLFGTASGGTISNVNSKAIFTITASYNVPGMAVWNNSTKAGTSGQLINATDFAIARAVVTGDTLRGRVTYTLT